MNLFKYLPPSRTSVLRDLRIRLTQRCDLNDPFDVNPNVNRFLPENSRSQVPQQNVTKARIPFDYSRLVPYTVDALSDPVSMLRTLPALNKALGRMVADPIRNCILSTIGVFSATDAPDNLSLWSVYADAHRGFVVEFDATHAFFNRGEPYPSPFGEFHQVTYSARRPTVAAWELLQPPEKWALRISKSVLFAKSLAFSNEREWRFLLPLHDHERFPHCAEGRKHLFQVPSAAIVRVIIGHRCAPTTVTRIQSAVERDRRMAHIEISFARISSDHFRIST
jgi:hypothetical protein